MTDLQVIYSSYTPAQKKATQKYRSNNKEKVNAQRKQYYLTRKEKDPDFLDYKRSKAREYYLKKKEERLVKLSPFLETPVDPTPEPIVEPKEEPVIEPTPEPIIEPTKKQRKVKKVIIQEPEPIAEPKEEIVEQIIETAITATPKKKSRKVIKKE